MAGQLHGVLLTGVFGSGKSAVAVEMADILDKAGRPFALLDLDYLGWYSAHDDDGHAVQRLLLRNLADVARNYVEAGVERFVLARAVQDARTLEEIRSAVTFPLTVVLLTAPVDEIRRRLADDPTGARADDLREAVEWIAAGTGSGLEDHVVANEGPLRAVALRVLALVGWA